MRTRLLLALATLLLAVVASFTTVASPAGAHDHRVDKGERNEGAAKEDRGTEGEAPSDGNGILISAGVILGCSALILAVGFRPNSGAPGHPN